MPLISTPPPLPRAMLSWIFVLSVMVSVVALAPVATPVAFHRMAAPFPLASFSYISQPLNVRDDMVLPLVRMIPPASLVVIEGSWVGPTCIQWYTFTLVHVILWKSLPVIMRTDGPCMPLISTFCRVAFLWFSLPELKRIDGACPLKKEFCKTVFFMVKVPCTCIMVPL